MHKNAIKAEKTKFAFLIHGMGADDLGLLIGNKLGIGERLGRYLFPETIYRLFWKGLRRCCKIVVCSRFETEEVEGYIIGLPYYAAEMLKVPRKQIQKQIADAAVYAQDSLGCSVVGLAAYTAPLSRNGLAVIKDPRVTCAITHGDALSGASAVATVQQVAALRNININQATIAVAGAYGLVGRTASILLSELQSARMILTGPNTNKLQRVAEEMCDYQGEIICSPDNNLLREADIMVLCTTATGNLVQPDMLRKNAIVVDLARPYNMGPDICKKRPEVLRVDGGLLRTGINPGFDLGTPTGVSLACFTETMLMALTNDRIHHVGPVDIDYARTIMEKASQFGFTPAPLTGFSKPISLPITKEPQTTPAAIIRTGDILSGHLGYVRELIDQGGPQPGDYEELNNWFSALRNMVVRGDITGPELQQMWDMAGEPFSQKTMQGLARSQPRGYAGDFQVIDRIYQQWTAKEDHLATWDHFYHWQKATVAVRNRKDYVIDLLRKMETSWPDSNDDVDVLNIGSGPGRDIHEYLRQYPDSRITFDCLDNDQEAVAFARQLCSVGESKVTFRLANVLRFRTDKKYQLIWSAGLFDYFNDRTFIFMLQRLATMLAPGGELVVGNFSENNPSRGYMECGNWFLEHRNEKRLMSLAQSVKTLENIRIEQEPEGVNLFLHIK